jgi:hypothetical protein
VRVLCSQSRTRDVSHDCVESQASIVAVVFTGTDDIRTSLEDVDVTQKPFGNNSSIYLNNDVRVHPDFDNAVFLHGIWDVISLDERYAADPSLGSYLHHGSQSRSC